MTRKLRSKYLIINSQDAVSDRGLTPTVCKVNFTNAPFVGKNVLQVTPKLVTFPNSLFNICEGWNDELKVTQYGGLFPYPEGVSMNIKFPPGFYHAGSWAVKFTELTASLPKCALHIDTNSESIGTVIFTLTSPGHTMTLSHATSHKKARNVLSLLGQKIIDSPEGIPYSTFDMGAGVPGNEGVTPMTFNWNNLVLLSCNITHSNSIHSDESRRVNNVMESIPLDDTERSCMVTMYHEEDAGLSRYFLDKGDSIQNMEFALLDKFGNVQQTYEEFEYHIMLRFDFVQ